MQEHSKVALVCGNEIKRGYEFVTQGNLPPVQRHIQQGDPGAVAVQPYRRVFFAVFKIFTFKKEIGIFILFVRLAGKLSKESCKRLRIELLASRRTTVNKRKSGLWLRALKQSQPLNEKFPNVIFGVLRINSYCHCHIVS